MQSSIGYLSWDKLMLETFTNSESRLTADGSLGNAELETVLEAWHAATERLQQTHEVLRREVRRLTDELEIKNRELARKNRLADLGQMASHVAHEVRNSLVPLTLYLSLLRRQVGETGQASDTLHKMESGFTALEAIVNDLLQFTSNQVPAWQTVQLDALVREVCEALSSQFIAQGITTNVDISPSISVPADRDMLRRAVLNLVLNALDAMPAGGELVITGASGSAGVDLEVADSGPGLASDIAQRLFEPFFTTKSGGTGLGLAIVERIATAHGGRVCASNCPQGGAAFTICIPTERMEAAA
ncbi:MAG: sensor histidine kinase [Planctomycetota bacterium]